MLLTPDQVTEFLAEIEKAYQIAIETGDWEKDLAIHLDLWNKLPEPKHQQPAQLADCLIGSIFGIYVKQQNYQQAKQWALEMLNSESAKEGADEWFLVGAVCYELNEFDDALKYFDIAYQRGKYYVFRPFERKYWEFYSEHKPTSKAKKKKATAGQKSESFLQTDLPSPVKKEPDLVENNENSITLLTSEQVAQFVTEIEQANLLGIQTDDWQQELSICLGLWDKLPEPKQKQPEQIANALISCIFDIYFENKNYLKAKEWALKGLNNDTAEYDSYEYIQMGRACYELNELDDALKYFDIAYQRGKYRAFQGYDKKYWQFYSEHKQISKSKKKKATVGQKSESFLQTDLPNPVKKEPDLVENNENSITLLTSEQIAQFVTEIEQANLLGIQTDDWQKELSIYLDLWDKLPEPKQQQPEQIANWLIVCIFNSYFKQQNYLQAKEWALKALEYRSVDYSVNEYRQMGMVNFELGDVENALAYFEQCYQLGKKRAFQGIDKKYWQFYSEHKPISKAKKKTSTAG